jgi:hypothetical protein
MPFPFCYRCGLRHRRDLACNTLCPRVNLYKLSGIIKTNPSGDIEYISPQVSHSCGALDNVCPFCQARFWSDENINCCNKGDIHFVTDSNVPAELQELLSRSHFMEHIRQYNTALAMASVGHDARVLSGGPSSVILSGRAFHRVPGAFVADPGWNPSFAQIYLLDAEEASEIRNGLHHNSLKPDILRLLHDVMLRDNPWVRQFRHSAADCQPLLWRWDGEDVNEAMVLGALIAAPGSSRNIIIRTHDSTPIIINDLHCLYHPLAYPLLFPSGMTGWFLGMKSQSDTNVTRVQYLKYLIMQRSEYSHIQRCGRLALEFYCDAWASHEANVMDFHKRPQQQTLYRSVSRAALIDQLPHSDAGDIGVPARTVLPSSVVGSPRFYHTLFLNAMALPRRFGKPDLFITMTANPNWEEIHCQIPQHSDWQNHPDIVARVFMIKVASLVSDIKERHIFGPAAAIVWRIEWQKRGLPHLHLLVILCNHIRCVDIDSFVCAEIPNPDLDPELYDLISKNNIHKPCDVCHQASCHQDGCCRRNFPKPMIAETTVQGDRFPVYRRRGRYITHVKDHNGNLRAVTDEWVVPYSPFLTLRYRCHINCEVAAHINTFKYLYKYVLKAPDHAAVVIDEINSYLDGRMLSASEAVFRILGLRLHSEWPPVMCLDIHLPNHERMIFDPNSSAEDLLDQSAVAETTLTSWFLLNQSDRDARNYLYCDIPEHYVWSSTLKRWSKRVRKGAMAVARIYAVSPRNSELYSLRLLLNVVRGATSWRCLLNVDGWIHGTFHDACLARGLLSSDSDHLRAFDEIVQNTLSASVVRQHFADFLLNVQVSEPVRFFETFVEHMVDGEYSDSNVQYALACIDRILRSRASSITTFGFDPVEIDVDDDESVIHYDCGESFFELYNQCTEEQRDAVDVIMNSTEGVFIVQGGAGTGKTLFVNCLAFGLKRRKSNVLCVASSALAASLLPDGKTAHSALSIPVPVMDGSFCRWDPSTRKQLRKTEVFIWDEMSMIHNMVAECVDFSLQDLHSNNSPFGGKVMVFVGDFKQLPPVVKKGKGEYSTLRKCSWWSTANKIQFTKNFRALDNQGFISELDQIGNGSVGDVMVPPLSQCSNEDEMIQRVFGEDILSCDNCIILTLKVQDASDVNDRVMRLLPGETFNALAADALPVETHVLPEVVASLSIPGAPNFSIPLKVNARYMVIKNYAPGVVNGTLCKLISFSSDIVHVQLLSGARRRSIVMLPRCTFQVLSGQFPTISHQAQCGVCM